MFSMRNRKEFQLKTVDFNYMALINVREKSPFFQNASWRWRKKTKFGRNARHA